MAKKSDIKEELTLTYDEALVESEALLNRLETEKLPIDEVLAMSKRVALLIKHCQKKIKEMGRDIDEIIDSLRDDGDGDKY